MRIRLKTKSLGNCRVIRRFTLFPMQISESEISWFEWVYIVKVIKNGLYPEWLSVNKYSGFEEFTDKQHYLKCKKYVKENNCYPSYREMFKRDL